MWGALVGAFLIVGSTQFGILACASSALAATCSVRGFCVQLGRNMQAAFELGKEAGRSEARLEGRPLSRV
ncbi:MAG: hypothetical protein CMJ18_07845 [Phycisphaeraceae bacterium]|nr:hypothetical protein [Phycisphaeraceae bacterium]